MGRYSPQENVKVIKKEDILKDIVRPFNTDMGIYFKFDTGKE